MMTPKPFGKITLALIALQLSKPVVAFADEAVEGALPQLDTTFYAAQLFWLAVCFGVLYMLMRYVAVPGVQKVQDNRKQTIAHELATARAANDEARALMVKIDQSLLDARLKARADIDAIKVEAAKTAADKLAHQQHNLTRHLHDAEAKIEFARLNALKNVEDTAADLAALIVEKVSGSPQRAASGGRS